MISLHLITKFFIVFLIVGVLFLGGMFLWMYRTKNTARELSDQQMIWLLVVLLVIAVMSMGTFISFLLEGLEPWHHLRI
jgi:heme/copper-type cytochrome/quinol oxidase subunit 2